MLFKFSIVAAVIGSASAACPNQCSGHGSCGNQDVCECYDNWGMGGAVGGDCSDRLCPFELAWVDAPNALGTVHNYAECAAKGICDRSTGECECLDGYEGKACARQTCKDNCNGHGTCAYMEQIPFGTVFGDWAFQDDSAHVALGKVGAERTVVSSGAWDFERSRACVCDSEWTGLSCDKKLCSNGNDAMFVKEYETAEDYENQIQQVLLVGNAAWGASTHSFALTFTSRTNQTYTTVPIFIDTCTEAAAVDGVDSDCGDLLVDVQKALEGLPNNVIDSVSVEVDYAVATFQVKILIEFDGENVQGRQNLLELDIDPCGAGCTPFVGGLVDNLVQSTSSISEIQDAWFNTYECGRRGKCDYDNGICSCFEGFTGPSCSSITALV